MLSVTACIAALTMSLGLIAACGNGAVATRSPAESRVSQAPPKTAPSVSATASAEDPSASAETSSEPTSPASVEPSASIVSPASACAGTDKNRDFFTEAARVVSWTVYCPVLSVGWVVDTGSYRLANGGRLEISYRNRSGARLELHEGAFCADASGCVEPGSDAGAASFGDLDGALTVGADGSLSLSVDAGKPISWLAVGRAIDEQTFRGAMSALIRVGD